MLDKFLTGEKVKVNCEIAGHRHILRTLLVTIEVNVDVYDFIVPLY
jgi:hypothetical protein